MHTTIEFLDAVKSRFCLPSDYAAARIIGVTKQAVSRYRNGHDYFGPDAAMKVAELLEIDPGYVLVCTQAERERSEAARSVWQALAANFESEDGGPMCIMSTNVRGAASRMSPEKTHRRMRTSSTIHLTRQHRRRCSTSTRC